MSRQRFIYPETFASEDFVSLTFGARLLFIGMFATADDYGRGKGSLGVLKATVFPEDELSKEQVAKWVEEIRKRKMVRFYEIDGSIYYEVVKWEKWQRPKYRSASKIPPCPSNYRHQPRLVPESGPIQGQSRDNSARSPATGSVGLGSVVLGTVGKGGEGSPQLTPPGEAEVSDPPPFESTDPDPEQAAEPELARPEFAEGLAQLKQRMHIPDKAPA